MSFPPPTRPKLGQSASASRVGGSNPKIDHTALRVQQTELASELLRARLAVGDLSVGAAGGPLSRAAATAPRPGAAAASLSIPRAVAAAPSRTLRSVGNFSLATDPAHLSPWERRVRQQRLHREHASTPSLLSAPDGLAPSLPWDVPPPASPTPSHARPMSVGKNAIGASWPSPGAEKAAAPAYMREHARFRKKAAEPFKEVLMWKLQDVEGTSSQMLSLMRRGDWRCRG
jgi:hypothetical protein